MTMFGRKRGFATYQNRSAMALLVVMVLVMMAALSAYGFTFYMESQYRTARIFEEQVHARQAALSATELVAAILEMSPQKRAALGGLENNPALFRDLVMESQRSARSQDDNSSYWRASVLAPRLSDETSGSASASSTEASREFSFGLENESAKIPLVELLKWDQRIPGHAKQVLLSLPGATEPIVNAYLRELESLAVSPGRTASRNANKSSSSDTSDVRMVQDELRMLWLGGDLNQNYRLDALDSAWLTSQAGLQGQRGMQGQRGLPGAPQTNSSTLQAAQSQNSQSSSRQLSMAGLAWQRYLTWHSGERNESLTGAARVNLNQPDLRSLHQQLSAIWPAEWADYVVAFRQYGGTIKATVAGGRSPSETRSSPAGAPDFSVPASRTILSPLELIGVLTQVPSAGGSSSGGPGAGKSGKREVSSPFQPDITQMGNYLSKLLDDVSVSNVPTSRIDVHSAPLPVLMAIPGMDRQLADAIIQRREGRSDSVAAEAVDSTIAWLLQDGIVDLRRLTALEPYLTGRSDVYSCQVVGYRDDLSAVYRCTLTIDARQSPAVKRNIQTWHSWDRGFSMTELSMKR